MHERYGAVICALNEAGSILTVLRGVKRYIQPDHIVVVDDGSSDETASIAESENVNVIRHPVSRGKGEALKSGFKYLLSITCIETILTVDADGQHDTEEIPSFIEYYETEQTDLLIGNRMVFTGEMPRIRIFANKLASAAVSLMTGCRVEDSQSGYRLIRTSFLKQLNLVTSHYETESEIIIKAGREKAIIKSIPIRSIYEGEKSAINPILDTLRFFILFVRSLFW